MLTDNEGTVRDVVQQVFASGTWQPTTVVDHLVYSAFGALTSQTNGAYQPRFGYTGQVYDAATGLSYYKARWYDPVTGDFIGQDPKPEFRLSNYFLALLGEKVSSPLS